MEKELRKFIVMLHPDSVAARVFGDDPDATISELPALTCSEMDLSGAHARVKRIPAETSRAATNGVQSQVLWIATADIALAIEYTGPSVPVGFSD